MKEVLITYGDGYMPAELPDTATIIRYKETYQDPPAVDPVEATRKALANPLGMPPLHELAKPGKTAVIAVPDRVKGGAHKGSHRRTCIPLIVEDLMRGGMRKEDITLLISNGLHRKNTLEEMYWYLGQDIVDWFWPDRLVVHDSEDPEGMVDLGFTEDGDVVTVNRLVYECDIPIQIGHVQGNPYGGYSGGYKMCATGLTSWTSIRCHHCPSTMFRDDFLPASTRSKMRKQFDAIGQAMEKGMGKPFFTVDAVLGGEAQVLGVYAGYCPEVQRESWKLADQRTEVYIDLDRKADVIIFGLPRTFHYGPGMGTNPVLMLQAIGGELTRVFDIFNEGGVLIVASLCDGWFNDEWFCSYREVHSLFGKVSHQRELTRFEEYISRKPEYVAKYRYAYSYHPFHAFSMMYMGAVATDRTSAVFIAGAREPGYARSMGCIPTVDIQEALKKAEKYVGNNPKIVALPDVFASVPVHLHMK